MDRNCRVVGFIGMDKYEYIMYLTRVLCLLDKKVLMVDCSETGALSSSVPCPEEIKNSVIEYRGVMFHDCRNKENKDPYSGKETNLNYEAYDFILIDYGYYTEAEGLCACDRIVCVTDQQAHNIQRITGIDLLKDKQKSLIIKDVVNSKITPRFIVDELKLENLSAKQTYVVYQDELDSKCRINCQYDALSRFLKLSMQSKNVIKGLVTELLPEITKKELEVAYKRAEKGE